MATPWFREIELFAQGVDGYHTYRIPALAVTTTGTVLAVCEGRVNSSADYGKIDIVLRRSTDGGATWSDTQIIHSDDDHTIGNPCIVVDQTTGVAWLTFCKDNDQVFVTSSEDDGVTWSEPRDITSSVKPDNWTWYATGPGHGIQLSSGRLVIPCDHSEGARHHSPFYFSHVIYSDDHGDTWQVGGSTTGSSDECEVVELADGRLYMTIRSADSSATTRLAAWSSDGGETWSDMQPVPDLIDPICQASIVRLTDTKSHARSRVVFANPASDERKRLTLRMSYDEATSWEVSKVLYVGPSAYSDLAVLPDASVACLYERGSVHRRESIRLAQFNIEWLTDGLDSLE
jgi:sialidase-1